ncbi:hypothetical protein F6U93_08370 [Tamlana haliotis]|uniref:DUF3157 family protein n=1 Tax=Pseudotamlana haliotis TaxID=2614804 RepID=A0A6N6MBJ3_9FLAO|nr:hypothetical protein [Tamlana haliotis]KAB1067946.1 hypothetical protein F6U93_08370 [Tamlana haliotis]
MKKTLFILSLLISTIGYSQNISAITQDGKTVTLKPNKTWVYADSEQAVTDNKGCDLGPNFKEGKVNKKLLKHVMVDMSCKEDEIIFISSSTGMGRGLYSLCVKGKPMKYKKIGTVFMKADEDPFEK